MYLDGTPPPPTERDPMITFQASVRIARPVAELFAYVADATQFPHWNSAVQSVRSTSPHPGEVGSTFLMRRELPTGPAENTLEILERTAPTAFSIRTTSGP